MDIYIDDIRLPVVPEQFSVSLGANHQTVDILELGELALRGKRKLTGLGFSSFFPYFEGRHGYQRHGKHLSAYALINKLKKKLDAGTVARCIITQTNVNMEVLITELTYGEEDGSRDIYYTIAMQEYVRPKVAVKNGGKSALYESTRDVKTPTVTTYTVKYGDTLKSIAKEQLGSSAKYTELAALNHIASPYTVTSGQVILIANG